MVRNRIHLENVWVEWCLIIPSKYYINFEYLCLRQLIMVHLHLNIAIYKMMKNMSRKITVFWVIFLLKKDISKLWNKLEHIHVKNKILWSKYIFSCHNCTIFYVYPKIFINFTIFAKFVSHFSSREITLKCKIFLHQSILVTLDWTFNLKKGSKEVA